MSYVNEAYKVVLGDRQAAYGNPRADFERTALVWTGILNGKLKEPITAEDIPLLMVGLKLCRQAHKHKDDNLVDIHGYGICLEWMITGNKPTQ